MDVFQLAAIRRIIIKLGNYVTLRALMWHSKAKKKYMFVSDLLSF